MGLAQGLVGPRERLRALGDTLLELITGAAQRGFALGELLRRGDVWRKDLVQGTTGRV